MKRLVKLSDICNRILSPRLGDEAGLWRWVVVPARQATYRLAGRYDNPTPWPTSSSSLGLRIGPLNKILLVQAEPTRKESKLSRKNKAKKESGVPLGNSSNAVVLTSTQLGKALFVLLSVL